VVRRCVRSRNIVNEEALAHWGLLGQIKKILNGKERILSSEGENSRSHYVESSLWTCRETDCQMNE
jgi:hypothetical protein